ncbi:MAG: yajC, partial [Cryobacterium sp.]|nr:yajC [Cryobacterium sp.]
VFFMFRNGRKRQKDQQELQSRMVAGAEVMTNFGMYGTIVSIDEAENKVALEVAPGTVVQIHRQTIARVVEPTVVADDDEADAVVEENAGLGDTPEFGQRLGDLPDTQPKKGDE